MFRFESLQSFFYLWLIPLLILMSVLFAKRARKKLQKALGSRAAPFLASSVSRSQRRLKLGLQCLVVFLMVVAMARPQMGESKQEVRSEGVELMLVVDVSESMMAEDVRPNRLEQAKTELGKLVEMMPGNKIGIVAFAGSAALLSPLTTDPSSLRMFLDSLSTSSVSTQGTEFKRALEEAEAAFKRGGVEADDTTRVTRVVLLASDGEDQEPGALEEAEKLAKEGIYIFSLIYGTEKGAPIPVRDGMGYLQGYKKDHQGQTILTTVKGDELTAIAKAGKGVAYHASFGGNHLQKIIEDVGRLEKTQFDTAIATQYDEQFQIFILLALIVALLEMFLGDRRAASRLWKGRFEAPEGDRG
jgi:Ca-activated chloride channel family protein